MSSKIDICNLALSRFGQGYIEALDEDTEAARLLDLNYDPVLQSVLREFPWNFATKVAYLALTTYTEPGWQYVYQYPSNCVKIRRVYAAGDARSNEKSEFKLFTTGTVKLIACDIEDAYAEYTYLVVDPSLFDPSFVAAFSYALASEICLPLIANDQKATEMYQKYQLILNKAHLAGAVENYDVPEWPSSYVTGRR